MNLQKDLKGKVKRGEPLKKHTSFRIGGRAKFFAEPADIGDLKSLLRYARSNKIKFLVIGSGSNVLAKDGVLNRLVIHLNAIPFKRVAFKGSYCQAGSGVLLASLVQKAKQRSLAGFEFCAGIPGTVGGALAGNAGAQGKSIADIFVSAEVMDASGQLKTLNKSGVKFGYRSSSLDKYIIIASTFKLRPDSIKSIDSRAKGYLSSRRQSQDYSYPNAGCIFRNPANIPAGKLIDQCGLKGKTIGGACVSAKHANFILNRKNASAKDVLSLIKAIRKQVKNRSGLGLQTEIKIWQ